MTAKIYAVPGDVGPPPSLSVGSENYMRLTEEWVLSVQDWVRKNSADKDPVVGELYRFPVADGYAEYVVFSTKPLRLIHLTHLDGWHMPDVVRRGLCLADIRQQASLAALLAGGKSG